MEEDLLIGQLSEQLGISSPTIRYYEKLGLIDPPKRTHAGYRLYSQTHRDRLKFIQKAKRFGLSLDEIGRLIAVHQNGKPPCREFKQMLQEHIDGLDRNLQEMWDFREELRRKYEQIEIELANHRSDLLEDICQGTICKFIERDS